MKKIVAYLGTIAVASIPIISVISCGNNSEEKTGEDSKKKSSGEDQTQTNDASNAMIIKVSKQFEEADGSEKYIKASKDKEEFQEILKNKTIGASITSDELGIASMLDLKETEIKFTILEEYNPEESGEGVKLRAEIDKAGGSMISKVFFVYPYYNYDKDFLKLKENIKFSTKDAKDLEDAVTFSMQTQEDSKIINNTSYIGIKESFLGDGYSVIYKWNKGYKDGVGVVISAIITKDGEEESKPHDITILPSDRDDLLQDALETIKGYTLKKIFSGGKPVFDTKQKVDAGRNSYDKTKDNIRLRLKNNLAYNNKWSKSLVTNDIFSYSYERKSEGTLIIRISLKPFGGDGYKDIVIPKAFNYK